ncbi:MAG: hypothetical protein ACI89J_000149 [Hyphomicrobiaceae bacterium]|jgi:hypothetical protein
MEEWMPLTDHLDVLSNKHRVLERKLEQARTHPSTSDSEVARIKREKLKIKDKIQQLNDNSTEH